MLQAQAADEFLTDSQREQLAERVEAQKEAARNAFGAQKAAAMAQAAIQTALGQAIFRLLQEREPTDGTDTLPAAA